MAQEQTVLPKGIVLNNETIYAEIAKYDIIPVEMILKSCRVYSTTSRKLYDPTARRLENFWTRLLGGDRRYLSGRLISQLFRDISEETAFVKLRGPDNRYEPPSPGSRPHDAQTPPSASASKLKLKSTTPSSKTPPRPILKRPRGISASGPRPTARFVSPPEPGIDGESTTIKTTKDSGSSVAKEEKVKGRSIKPKKKATAFVASTSRRRPGMPRRSSSQSSAGASDPGSKEGDSSLGSKYDGSQSSVPTILEKPERQPASTKKGKGTVGMSAKAAGKRPMVQPQVDKSVLEPEKVGSSQSQNAIPSAEQSPDQSGRTGNAARNIGSRSKTSSPSAVLKTNTQQEASPLMIQSSSDAGPVRPTTREASRATVPPTSLMSSTPAKLDTSVIGQGTISGFKEDLRAQSASLDRPGDSSAHGTPDTTSEIPSGSGLSRPTQPSTTAAIPLARSKSQLSLLLDRKGEKPKSKR